MIDLYRDTDERHRFREWVLVRKLLKLVAASEGEGKWRSFASLAEATDRAPEVAKYCLSLTMLTRVQCGKTGRGATKSFISPDFIAAKRKAETIEWAARPWDKEDYEGTYNEMNLCRMSSKKSRQGGQT